MASFISSENLSTYLLRELVRYTSNPERGFPEAYQTGDDENLYSTVRNIIAISTKDPTINHLELSLTIWLMSPLVLKI